MPTRRSAETTPDLFSEAPTAKAPEPLSKTNRGSQASQPRHFLPEDLAGALKRLNNAEIDVLLAAVTTEAERRGRVPSSRSKARLQLRQTGTDSLTTGKLNAVRAAFNAGVKPSAIARQFGISQSDIRAALATEGRDRKSGR
jgi:hypothetical protein